MFRVFNVIERFFMVCFFFSLPYYFLPLIMGNQPLSLKAFAIYANSIHNCLLAFSDRIICVVYVFPRIFMSAFASVMGVFFFIYIAY